MVVSSSNFSSIREIADIVRSAVGKVRLFGCLAIEGLAFLSLSQTVQRLAKVERDDFTFWLGRQIVTLGTNDLLQSAVLIQSKCFIERGAFTNCRGVYSHSSFLHSTLRYNIFRLVLFQVNETGETTCKITSLSR